MGKKKKLKQRMNALRTEALAVLGTEFFCHAEGSKKMVGTMQPELLAHHVLDLLDALEEVPLEAARRSSDKLNAFISKALDVALEEASAAMVRHMNGKKEG